MINAKIKPFEQAVQFLPMFKDKLLQINTAVRENVTEIRLRSGREIVLELSADRHNDNKLSGKKEAINRLTLPVRVGAEDLRRLIECFCGYSVHSFTRQIAEGFITLEGGHRAGFCGTAVVDENGRILNIRDITSVNLRIAREFIGCSDELFNLLPKNDITGLIILGKPLSAKTTVLRDLIRNLSLNYKVAVIDERGEISAKSKGIITADLGLNTDVLDSFPKKAGFITALRSLSPDFIACDEITANGAEIEQCLNCGVAPIVTAHCGSLEEALVSPALKGVMQSGINYAALLGTEKNIGRLMGLWRRDEENENCFSGFMRFGGNGSGVLPLGGA